jgi:hypothetical protein
MADSARPTTHATLFGIGGVRQLDTYLSPLNYHGPQVQFMHETLRPTHWREISFQSLWQADLSASQNEAGKRNLLGGNMSYDVGWHYNWHPTDHLRVMAGPQIGGNIGFLYHSRNSNNPAQARLNADVSASLTAAYHLALRRQFIGIRYQIRIPMAGCMFSPQYGQSYYEISEGSRDHNAVFTHPANAPSFWQTLTADIALRRYTLRIAYLADIRQSHVNHIKAHDYNQAFMIGMVRHFRLLNKTERGEGGLGL